MLCCLFEFYEVCTSLKLQKLLRKMFDSVKLSLDVNYRNLLEIKSIRLKKTLEQETKTKTCHSKNHSKQMFSLHKQNIINKFNQKIQINLKQT